MVRREIIEQAADPIAEEQALINVAPLKRIATPGEIGLVVATRKACLDE